MPDRPRLLQMVRRVLAPILLCIAAVAVVAVHVPQHDAVSPIDELVYIDYFAKVPTQGVVHRGEEMGDFARGYLDCHGVLGGGFYDEAQCASTDESDDARFPQAGVTSADIYTPLYFATTWVLAQPLVAVGVDLVDAGRYVGAFWLGLAAVLLYLALGRLRIPSSAAFGVSLLMLGTPAAFWSASYISTDAPAFAAGAALLFLVARYRPDRLGIGLIVVSILATLIKVQNIAAVGAVGLAFLVMGVREAIVGASSFRAGLVAAIRHRRVLTAVLAVVGSLVAQLVWMLVRNAIAVGPSPDQGLGQPLTRTAMIDEFFKFFGTAGYGPAVAGTAMTAGAMISLWITVAGVLGAAALARRNSLEANLGGATFVVGLIIGPALAVFTTAFAGYYFQLPVRYGMSLLPLMLASAAWVFTQKPVLRWALLAAGVVTFAAGLAISNG